jgi:sulfate-transporting ATPase
MTVGENLLAACEKPTWWQGARDLLWPREVEVSEAAARAARDFGLEHVLGQTPRSLDHGRRRLVAIARAFASDPALLFLDEPAAGLDAQERKQLGSTLRKVASEWNVGILLVEHDVDMVFRVCDEVTALVAGVPVAAGTAAEVRVDAAVTDAYLGRAETVEPTAVGEGALR